MSNSHIVRVASLALCASLAVGSPRIAQASSAPDPNSPSIRIAYRVADVRTPDGARRLAHRVKQAAAEVCDGDDPVMWLGKGFATCEAATIRRAVAGLNEPLLAQALGIAPSTLALAAR
jgi:UrcA family protein